MAENSQSFTTESAGIKFDNVQIRQLRGAEWGRDFSLVGQAPSLLMPSIDFIEAGDLQWDGLGSWLDAKGVAQVMDPWWWCDKGPALIIRPDYLDRILEERKNALVIMGIQTKFVVGSSSRHGSKRQTRLIRRKIAKD